MTNYTNGTHPRAPERGAAAVSGAPTTNRFLLVSSPDRHVFLFGTETTIAEQLILETIYFLDSLHKKILVIGTQLLLTLPVLLEYKMDQELLSAVRSRGSILVWTDTALHALNNIGPPFIFGLQQVGANCGAVSPNCVVDVNGVTFWMSQTAFL